MKIKVGAVVGPTASGKTALAIGLARELNGEVVSCDSMQIYRYMDIGTAKPTKEEQSAVPHHLIDIIEPTEDFSCADYSVLANAKIKELTERGKFPIFCGGTGLYVDHVLRGTSFSEAGKDEEYRKKLENDILQNGADAIYKQLCGIDPLSAANIHPNNTKRLIRAMEIYHVTGKTKTEWDAESKKAESPYDVKMIFLDYRDREKLYSRIDQRVDMMMKQGLLDEVASVTARCDGKLSNTAVQAIGYKEIIEYLNGNSTLENAVEKIKQYSRNYAKRQITWFKRYDNCHRIYVDDYNNFDDIVNIAKKIFSD